MKNLGCHVSLCRSSVACCLLPFMLSYLLNDFHFGVFLFSKRACRLPVIQHPLSVKWENLLKVWPEFLALAQRSCRIAEPVLCFTQDTNSEVPARCFRAVEVTTGGMKPQERKIRQDKRNHSCDSDIWQCKPTTAWTGYPLWKESHYIRHIILFIYNTDFYKTQ